jgi:hypothetical protein
MVPNNNTNIKNRFFLFILSHLLMVFSSLISKVFLGKLSKPLHSTNHTSTQTIVDRLPGDLIILCHENFPAVSTPVAN